MGKWTYANILTTLFLRQVKDNCEIVDSTIKMEASFAGKVINDYNTEYKKTGEMAIPRKPPTK